MRSLQRGDLGKGNSSAVDNGLRVAIAKMQELDATDPTTLAGVGRFQGFHEVLSISDRSLQDVSSALKEVVSTVSGADGTALEEVLEHNIRLRKASNTTLQEILHQVEKGSSASGGGESVEIPGIRQFFEETRRTVVRMKAQEGSSTHMVSTI